MSSSLHLLNVGQNKILNTAWTPGQQQQVGDIQSRLQLQLNRHRTLLFPLFLVSLFQVKGEDYTAKDMWEKLKQDGCFTKENWTVEPSSPSKEGLQLVLLLQLKF
ncbi:unnamed protein product [Sphagnum tenellum]